MLTAHTLPMPEAAGKLNLGSSVFPICPTEIRLQVASLVAEDKMNEANALSKRSLHERPCDEELLVTRILVCEILHQWQEAADCLRLLLTVQGREAPAETWHQYVRVLRCQGLMALALDTSQSALAWHPHHAGLMREREALMSECSSNSSTSAT